MKQALGKAEEEAVKESAYKLACLAFYVVRNHLPSKISATGHSEQSHLVSIINHENTPQRLA